MKKFRGSVYSLLLFVLLLALAAQAGGKPVIIDTDIGDDIDDTWALAVALRSPELDLKLVVGDYGKPDYRARLIAKLLETAGRTDIPVGVGIEHKANQQERQAEWISDYPLSRYPGKVYKDGVGALVDTIMRSPERITLIAIGPTPNLAEALRRNPEIARKVNFVGMYGSVRVGYSRSPKPAAEWNVKADLASCQKVFTAPWEMTITPLDTCGAVQLKGKKYGEVTNSTQTLARAVIDNYNAWSRFNAARKQEAHASEPPVQSTTLYDCVAVYLAIEDRLCQMEKLKLIVDDNGFTREDPKGKTVNAAMDWKDLPAFENWLVNRVAGEVPKLP